MEVVPELTFLVEPLQEKLNQALENLTHKKVDLSIKDCGLLTIPDVHSWIDTPDTSMTAIYVPIVGDAVGDIFVLLPQVSAHVLADLMIGNPAGTTNYIGEFEASALKELGNITTGVIVTVIADLLKISMMLTVPNLASDMVGALVDQVLVEYGETANELLVLKFPFQINSDDKTIDGAFVLFFNKTSMDLLLEKLKTINNPGGNS